MFEDMTVRGFTARTHQGYIRAVKDFTSFLGGSPDGAIAGDLRRYQLHLRSCGASATSMNAAVSALRFFFDVTLGRSDAQVSKAIVSAPLQALTLPRCRAASHPWVGSYREDTTVR